MKNQIFISYRRGSGLYMAKNIAVFLEKKGYRVFFDYTSMENGMFNQQIYTAIEQADDFILVLSDKSLDNCILENDWVKEEILYARRLGKNILLAQDEMKFTSYPKLPDDLDFLKYIDWTPVNPKLFEGSMALLEKRLVTPKPTLIKSIAERMRLHKRIIIGVTAVVAALLAYYYWPLSLKEVADDYDEVSLLLPASFSDKTEIYESAIETADNIDIHLFYQNDDQNAFLILINEDLEEVTEKEISLEQYVQYVIASLSAHYGQNDGNNFSNIVSYPGEIKGEPVYYLEYDDRSFHAKRAIFFRDECFYNLTLACPKEFVTQQRYMRAFPKIVKSFKLTDE